MEIVKKNLISIIFGVISLALLTAPMWLLNPAQEEIRKNLNERITAAKKINSLLTKERQLPIVDENSTPQKLNQFPNKLTIARADDMMAKVHLESVNLMQLAVDQNSQGKELLEPNSLPSPGSSAAFNFRDTYLSRVRSNYIGEQILHGGAPPSPQDIKEEMDRVYKSQYLSRVVTYPDGKDNRKLIDEEFKKASSLIPLQLQIQRANKLSMYADERSFSWSRDINPTSNPTPLNIWNAQVGYWIQQDLANAIASANVGTKNVTDAVVKRVVSIKFDAQAPISRKTGAAAMMGAAGTGSTVTPDTTGSDQPLPKDLTVSVTGRVSNGMYDVVQLDVVLHVDAARVNTVLRKLSDNHFIYIRQMQYVPVNLSKIQSDRYFYGTEPVVELNLSCEMLFLRQWTTPYMPTEVKNSLGIVPPGQAGNN